MFWTDDEPDDGAQYYFIICGFPYPQLLPVLSDLGIHVGSVIKISSDDYQPLQSYLEATAKEDEQFLPPEGELKCLWSINIPYLVYFEYILSTLK